MLAQNQVAMDPLKDDSRSKKYQIYGISLPIFLVIAAIVLVGVSLDIPHNMLTGFAVTMVLGGLLMWVGDNTPLFGKYGGGSILCLLLPSILVYLGWFPENGVMLIDSFFSDFGFSEFLVAGIIAGSILSMDREVLMKAGVRIFIPILGGVLCCFVIIGLIGTITGFGLGRTLLFVVAPVMGGGVAAGVIPMADMYAASGGESAGFYLAMLVPAVMVANIFCVVLGAVLNRAGKNKPNLFNGFNGNGVLLRDKVQEVKEAKSSTGDKLVNLAAGCLVAGTLFVFGSIMSTIFPSIHTYVWLIAAASLVKIFRLMPSSVEQTIGNWYSFTSSAWVPCMLVAISASVIEFSSVISIFSDPFYLILTIISVLVATAAAGIVGWLVKLNFIESAIAAGLGMADMGGSGDVAVLSASERMGLMPFMQIASRIGGALMLVIVSILAPIFI